MNEAETRAEHIDPALKAAGWGVAEGSRVHREYHIAPALIPKTFIFANNHYQGATRQQPLNSSRKSSEIRRSSRARASTAGLLAG